MGPKMTVGVDTEEEERRTQARVRRGQGTGGKAPRGRHCYSTVRLLCMVTAPSHQAKASSHLAPWLQKAERFVTSVLQALRVCEPCVLCRCS